MDFSTDNVSANSANRKLDNEASHRSNKTDEQSLQRTSNESATKTVTVTIEMSPNPEKEMVPVPGTIEKTSKFKDKKDPRHRKLKKEEVTIETHLTSLAHVTVLVFVYLVLKLAFKETFEFFTWHPILMSVGWMLLMTEGFYAINRYNTFWRRKVKGDHRLKIHVTILALGYLLSIIGFTIVYINKENKGKSHFVSWHGLFGLIGLISTLPPIINGTVLWYKKELDLKYPRLIKFVHVLSGSCAFAFGALSLALSVYTKWWGRRTDYSAYWFYFGLINVCYPLIWAVYGPATKLARVVKEYFSEEKDD